MNFTTKERNLLEDQKNQEKMCVQKYSNYADLATDPQLKNIFTQLGQVEQEHYNTIEQLLNGQMPQMKQSGGGSQQSGNQQGMSMSSSQSGQNQMKSAQSQTSFIPQSQSSGYNTSDKDLCSDLLMTEKYVSSSYNTAIFEFRDPQIRDILNHIQKEEQQHGETLYQYMASKGMYQAQ
ncbi:spore coat protein [Sedimentibacter sp.]|uniref:spore coat protein n=1 Tax=Sedimentibacter sp. TaxID=1960295 RepID=UPI00289D0445|nr:spore coat protein [Sedimentibacter sp.]